MNTIEPTITDYDIQQITNLLRSGNLGFGDNVRKFETKFSKYSNKKFNIGLNSASAAAYCLYAYLYERYGQCDIYTPSLGFTSVSWAAKKNGHQVHFVDVDRDLLFDFASYKDMRAAHSTPNRKTVLMPVLYGGVSNVPNFSNQVTDEIVVVDSAHCIEPSMYSDYIFFSFHPFKPLAMSCGGLLGTDDHIASDYVLKYRNFGRQAVDDTYDIVSGGFNFYMNNLNATLGLSQLKTCFKNIEARKNNLSHLKDNIPPDIGYFTHHDDKSSYYLGTLILNKGRSTELRKKMRDNKCNASFHYPLLHKSQFYNTGVSLKRVEDLSDSVINLPIHQNLTMGELDKIIEVISG